MDLARWAESSSAAQPAQERPVCWPGQQEPRPGCTVPRWPGLPWPKATGPAHGMWPRRAARVARLGTSTWSTCTAQDTAWPARSQRRPTGELGLMESFRSGWRGRSARSHGPFDNKQPWQWEGRLTGWVAMARGSSSKGGAAPMARGAVPQRGPLQGLACKEGGRST
jgi:hypothetical protein